MPASIKHLHEFLNKPHLKSRINLFARWPGDRLYYSVRLLQLNAEQRTAYISYEDGTECWTKNTDLHLQFQDTEEPYKSDEDIVCCVCDDGISKSPNDIILCDVCQQGYHQKCHHPNVKSSDLVKPEWQCATCEYMMSQLTEPKAMLSSTPLRMGSKKAKKVSEKKTKENTKQSRIKLPKRTENKDVEMRTAPGELESSSDESEKMAVVTHKSGATIETLAEQVADVTRIIQKSPEQVITEEFVESITDVLKNDDDLKPMRSASQESKASRAEMDQKKSKREPRNLRGKKVVTTKTPRAALPAVAPPPA